MIFFERNEKRILALLIGVFAVVGVLLSLAIPLGEAPDEGAHFEYVQFVAQHGRLPATQTDRDKAGYRSDWPGLYQVIAAPIVSAVPVEGGPQTLKAMGTDPRRLLATDGLTGLAFLHTDDEAPPYRGIVARWHALRLLSVLFSAGTLVLIFATLRLEFSAAASLLATAAVAATPQFLRMSAVANDDALLGLLIALFLRLLWLLTRREICWRRYALSGLVAGLAIVTKYSAVFMAFDALLLLWLFKRRLAWKNIAASAAGGIIGAGWWFAFVIRHFNRIDEFGLVRGSLAPFLLGGSDVTTRRLAAGLGIGGVSAPLADALSGDWSAWLGHLAQTFWFPASVSAGWWGSVAVLGALVALLSIWQARQSANRRRRLIFLIGHSALFVPLLLLRFILTQNIAETAQGRHLLIPMLLPLAFLAAMAVSDFKPKFGAAIAGGLVALSVAAMALAVWPKLTVADTPYLPVQTGVLPAPEILLNAQYRGEIELLGAAVESQNVTNFLPVTLFWQAAAIPTTDYTVRITLFDGQNRAAGVWRGQPVNGRYPTRAWDIGDVVTDQIRVPLLAGAAPQTASVAVFNSQNEPVAEAISFALPPITRIESASAGGEVVPRSDRLSPDAPYRYRATIAVRVADWPATATSAALLAPDGTRYPPLESLAGDLDRILLFSVDWRWASGDYSPVLLNELGEELVRFENVVTVKNNHRLTEAPPISRPLNANFGDQLILLGYDLPVNRVDPGGAFEVTLYWQNLQLTDISYKIFNHLLDESQVQYGGRDRIPQNFYSTVLWQPGEVIIDRYFVPVVADAPSGVYRLNVGVYNADDPQAGPLSLVQNGESLPVNSVNLGPVKVGGQPAESIPSDEPQSLRQDRFGDSIVLTGTTLQLDPEAKTATLDLYWVAIASPPMNQTLFIHVVNAESGETLAQADAPPVYPTAFWEPGEAIFDSRQLPLSNLPAGTYQIRLGWYDPATGIRLSVTDNPDGYVTLTAFEWK